MAEVLFGSSCGGPSGVNNKRGGGAAYVSDVDGPLSPVETPEALQ